MNQQVANLLCLERKCNLRSLNPITQFQKQINHKDHLVIRVGQIKENFGIHFDEIDSLGKRAEKFIQSVEELKKALKNKIDSYCENLIEQHNTSQMVQQLRMIQFFSRSSNPTVQELQEFSPQIPDLQDQKLLKKIIEKYNKFQKKWEENKKNSFEVLDKQLRSSTEEFNQSMKKIRRIQLQIDDSSSRLDQFGEKYYDLPFKAWEPKDNYNEKNQKAISELQALQDNSQGLITNPKVQMAILKLIWYQRCADDNSYYVSQIKSKYFHRVVDDLDNFTTREEAFIVYFCQLGPKVYGPDTFNLALLLLKLEWSFYVLVAQEFEYYEKEIIDQAIAIFSRFQDQHEYVLAQVTRGCYLYKYNHRDEAFQIFGHWLNENNWRLNFESISIISLKNVILQDILQLKRWEPVHPKFQEYHETNQIYKLQLREHIDKQRFV